MDGIERDLAGSAHVLRLNVVDGVGGQLAARYNVRGVPTFLVLDGEGEVVLRQVGRPQRKEIMATIASLSG